MNRFVTMTQEEAKSSGVEKPWYGWDETDSYYDSPGDVLVDTKTNKIVYTDGGEPEDMILCRNLQVFVDLLNNVNNES